MKILFIARASLYTNSGGDTMQIVNTAHHLRALGIGVDIELTDKAIDYSGYDLLHFFNIIRPADILSHIKRSGKPFVVSTIFVDYSETEKNSAGSFRKLLTRFISGDGIEYLKVIARMVRNKEKIGSLQYLLKGHRRSVKQVIKQAALLLPNSKSEYLRLVTQYTIQQQYRVIPNGIDTAIFNFPVNNPVTRENDMVICVARIEPLKNQLRLIQALNESKKFRLFIIGSPSANHLQYYEECRRIAAGNVSFISKLPQTALLEYYLRSKVHVLPSWFETTGLSTLEAAAMGCNIVITDKGDTREYFQDYGYYCDPGSSASIREAIEKAAANSVNPALTDLIRSRYTWQQAAEKTFDAYKEILSNN